MNEIFEGPTSDDTLDPERMIIVNTDSGKIMLQVRTTEWTVGVDRYMHDAIFMWYSPTTTTLLLFFAIFLVFFSAWHCFPALEMGIDIALILNK